MDIVSPKHRINISTLHCFFSSIMNHEHNIPSRYLQRYLIDRYLIFLPKCSILHMYTTACFRSFFFNFRYLSYDFLILMNPSVSIRMRLVRCNHHNVDERSCNSVTEVLRSCWTLVCGKSCEARQGWLPVQDLEHWDKRGSGETYKWPLSRWVAAHNRLQL